MRRLLAVGDLRAARGQNLALTVLYVPYSLNGGELAVELLDWGS